MRSTLLVLLILAVAGCGGTMQLLPRDGGAGGTGSLNIASKTMEVTVEGKRYAGNYVVAVQHNASGGPGNALLMAPDGDTIRCEFTATAMRAIGTCQTRAGRVFDMQAQRN